MKVLFSAFEPFGGRSENASQKVLEGAKVPFVSLPVVFGEAWTKLENVIQEQRPTFVLALGEAQGRDGCQFERIALNRRFARLPDNKGHKPSYEEIRPGEPLALESLWPDDSMIQNLKERGHEVSISCHAGTYVCNDLYYLMLFHQRRYHYQAGFLHLPESISPDLGAGLIHGLLAALKG